MKQSETISLELPLIFPEIADPKDRCVQRLVQALSGRSGIDRVHLKETESQAPVLCLHYQPALIAVSRVKELVTSLGAELTQKYGHFSTRITIPLHARSARLFANRLRSIQGVLEADVSPSGAIRVEYERAVLSQLDLSKQINALGGKFTAEDVRIYEPEASSREPSPCGHGSLSEGGGEYDKHEAGQEDSSDSAVRPHNADHEHKHEHDHGDNTEHRHEHDPKSEGHAGHDHGGIFGEKSELIFAFLAGAFVLAGWLVGRAEAGPDWMPTALFCGAYLFGGYFTSKEALENILARRFEIDTLMLVAAIGAAALGKWAEGGLLLFLFSLGHSLEHFAMGRARRAIEALAELAPDTALLKQGEASKEVRVETLKPGDIIIVKPNERLAADGVVVKGNTSVNQAPVTGESVPVDKQPVDDGAKAIAAFDRVSANSRVFAGTINGSGAVEVMVARLATQSTMARVVQMVADAEAQRSPTQQFTDKFERIFVPVVLALVGILMLAFLVIDEPFADSFYRAMAVLVAASPCALAISVPSAVLSGVARAGRGGVLIKGGGPLENLGTLTSIAFDKTGTLTEGRPKLTDVLPEDGISEEQLLAVVLAVETNSDHPLASALVEGAKAKLGEQVQVPTATEVKSITGRGVQAKIDGETVYIAKPIFFTELNAGAMPVSINKANEQLVKDGRTTMIVRKGEQFLGTIGVMDTPREIAASVMARLRALGIERLIMISGDNQQVADAVARTVGLTEARGDLMPEQKVDAIKQLREQHGKVAMVGDGVNDAPAMANATVGIAMGAAGSDVALEAADVALMGDDLGQLPFVVGLSRQTTRIIKQNLWVSLGVVAVLIPATIFGLNIGTAVLFHEGSTILVVVNALRLLAFQDTAPELPVAVANSDRADSARSHKSDVESKT
ncbi:heavy metal translocating P-type ATPase [Undibacterium sp. Jales W-56]|uniref:heavy metal translocating P-type ATPase n=1 Tax=Undibacterium sp. Jales W-56 TaxID=2897325 RepID=UPI0021D2F498|nr:heavy metal translocating P-type ATPase [Undibacterium sp. Jales W-56]MCU6435285.1 heavy metal translocating P-type ATPase [Undibacterium sp. Jales W-56]